MTNTVSNSVKKAQVNLIIVGREGKVRVCRMRGDMPRAKASNAMLDVPQDLTLRQFTMQTVADEITKASDAFVKKGQPVNIEVYTIGQVAIKYYQMVPYLKGGHFMTDEDIEAISSERDTTEDRCAYDDMAQAIAKVIAAGNGVHLQASGNADLFELIIPDKVVVEEGQLLDFTDGVSPEGIMVRGWRNANRKGAKVIVKGTRNRRAYITKAADPANPWRDLATLLNTINGCWDSLPKPAVDKSNDDGISEEDLYAA